MTGQIVTESNWKYNLKESFKTYVLHSVQTFIPGRTFSGSQREQDKLKNCSEETNL